MNPNPMHPKSNYAVIMKLHPYLGIVLEALTAFQRKMNMCMLLQFAGKWYLHLLYCMVLCRSIFMNKATGIHVYVKAETKCNPVNQIGLNMII